MNAPIQGTAADIMKLAMIAVDKKLKQNNLKSKLVAQVHDELIVDATRDELFRLLNGITERIEPTHPGLSPKQYWHHLFFG